MAKEHKIKHEPIINHEPTIKYVCVATERKLYLPYLEQLIPNLVILGLNTPWAGFITKYKLLLEYLSSPELTDDDMICFIDAYDVLPTKHLKHFESNYKSFCEKNPEVKIIVGYDKVDNIFHEFACQLIFGTIGTDRLNSGQFIGSVKYVREMVTYILKTTPAFQTDQIELTKYANQFKTAVYIDKKQDFFYVKSRPLQEICFPRHLTSAFIHSNGNGFLTTFLSAEHGIELSLSERWQNSLDNVKGVIKKIVIYDLIFIKKNWNLFFQLYYKILKAIYKWFVQSVALSPQYLSSE
jgi:hypothetical protein